MRHRSADAAQTRTDESQAHAEPLDETEQDSIIREFEVLASVQCRTWRAMFGTGAVLLGAFYAYSAWRQHVAPYGVRYTGELQSVTTAAAVLAVLALQGLALLAAAAALLANLPPKADAGSAAAGREAAAASPPPPKPPPRPRDAAFAPWQAAALWGGVAAAAAGGGYWLAALVRLVQVHGSKYGSRWELSWLPAAPLAWCALCAYVVRMLQGNERDLQRLKSYRYRYKKL